MILNMYKSRRIVEVDEFRTDYNYSTGFGTVYAILRNGETIALTRVLPPSSVVSYRYMATPPTSIVDPDADDDSVSNKDIWVKIRKAITSGKPVSLPI